jgi:hypothetical protein
LGSWQGSVGATATRSALCRTHDGIISKNVSENRSGAAVASLSQQNTQQNENTEAEMCACMSGQIALRGDYREAEKFAHAKGEQADRQNASAFSQLICLQAHIYAQFFILGAEFFASALHQGGSPQSDIACLLRREPKSLGASLTDSFRCVGHESSRAYPALSAGFFINLSFCARMFALGDEKRPAGCLGFVVQFFFSFSIMCHAFLFRSSPECVNVLGGRVGGERSASM